LVPRRRVSLLGHSDFVGHRFPPSVSNSGVGSGLSLWFFTGPPNPRGHPFASGHQVRYPPGNARRLRRLGPRFPLGFRPSGIRFSGFPTLTEGLGLRCRWLTRTHPSWTSMGLSCSACASCDLGSVSCGSWGAGWWSIGGSDDRSTASERVFRRCSGSPLYRVRSPDLPGQLFSG
jgi:hypothetical protein